MDQSHIITLNSETVTHYIQEVLQHQEVLILVDLHEYSLVWFHPYHVKGTSSIKWPTYQSISSIIVEISFIVWWWVSGPWWCTAMYDSFDQLTTDLFNFDLLPSDETIDFECAHSIHCVWWRGMLCYSRIIPLSRQSQLTSWIQPKTTLCP